MNNKGFAITTILYGTLILFMLLLVSMLGILSSYKDRLGKLIDGNNGARNIINVKYGDVDLNGLVNSDDLSMLSGYVSGNVVLTSQARANADVNADGVVNGDDVSLLSRFVGGISCQNTLPDYPCK